MTVKLPYTYSNYFFINSRFGYIYMSVVVSHEAVINSHSCPVIMKEPIRVWVLVADSIVRVQSILKGPDAYGHLMRLCSYVSGHF